jgi:hypothetical protein
MRITRRGAGADHGLKYVELKKLKFKWNPNSETFDISAGAPASDFSTSARHNYTLKLGLSEVGQLISALGAECRSIDSDDFVEHFAASVPALVRMTARASEVA